MQIHYKPSPNYSSRRGNKVNTIVVHATAGSLGGTLAWFAQRRSGVSAHYTISKKGAIYKHVAETNKAWHAGRSKLHGRRNVNAFSIGIELVNKNNGKDPYPQAQLESLAWLVNDIASRYKIPAARVVSHYDIAPGRKTDPKKFPWGKFWGIMRANHWPKKSKAVRYKRVLRFTRPLMVGADVYKVQKRLGQTRDSKYGRRTAAAVRRFQKSYWPGWRNRREWDSRVGPKTWKALGLD